MTQAEKDYLDERFGRLEEGQKGLSEAVGSLSTSVALSANEAKHARETCEAHDRSNKARIGILEANQRWVVMGILGVVGLFVAARLGLAGP